MALPEALASLATVAAQGLVSAVTTDRWPTARDGFAHLFGHANPRQVGMIEGHLESTREDLLAATGPEQHLVRADHQAAWRARLGALLEAHPALADDLRVLLDQLQRGRPTTSASG